MQFVKNNSGGFDICDAGSTVYVSKPLREVRNTRSGDVFIVATGPSIGKLDLAPLKGQFFIGMNGAINKFDDYDFKPQYYLVGDDIFAEITWPIMEKALQAGGKFFLAPPAFETICRRGAKYLPSLDAHLIFPLDRAPEFIGGGIPNPRKDPDLEPYPGKRPPIYAPHGWLSYGFSRNLEKGFFRHGSSTDYCMQLAYYLGFRRMFLLGHDLSFDRHFYPDTEDVARHWPKPGHVEMQLGTAINNDLAASKLCKDGEIQVFNVNPDSNLPAKIFPKISFGEVLKMKGL